MSVLFRGVRYELGHLAPLQLLVAVSSRPQPLTVTISFRNHCYTEAYDESLHVLSDILFNEGGVQGGPRARVFSTVRHELSLRLPQMVQGWPQAWVKQTVQERNWVYVAEVAIDPAVIYYVFFEIKKAKPDPKTGQRPPHQVEIIVESAYPSAPGRGTPDLSKGRMKFPQLVEMIFQGKAVRV